MAEETQGVILGVDASGAASGLSAFFAEFERLGPGLQQAIQAVAQSLPDDALASKGAQIVQRMAQVMQQGASQLGDAGGRGGIGGSLLQAVGLSPQNLREFDTAAQTLSEAYSRIAASQQSMLSLQERQRRGSPSGIKNLIPGMPDEQSIARSTEAMRQYLSTLEALGRVQGVPVGAVAYTSQMDLPLSSRTMSGVSAIGPHADMWRDVLVGPTEEQWAEVFRQRGYAPALSEGAQQRSTADLITRDMRREQARMYEGMFGSDPRLAQTLQRQQAWESPQAQKALDQNQQALSRQIRERVESNIALHRAEIQAAQAQAGLTRRQRQLIGEGSQADRLAALRARGTYEERLAASIETGRQAAFRRQMEREGAFGGPGGSGGPNQPPTFRSGFMAGWSGGPDGGRPWSEMMGQTARIALSYGVAYRALTLLQDAIGQIAQATLQYESSLTDLEIATGRNREQNMAFASQLSTAAVGAGFTAGVGVELGWRSLGLLGIADADQATQERSAQVAAETALRVARVSGADPVGTQTQMLGALRSFGWGVDRLSGLEDAITYIARNTGQQSTELLEASANLSTLGASAGFSPQQIMALVAQIATTTGQDPSASAGQFRQVLAREARVIGPQAGAIFGIDTTGLDLAGIIEAVSQIDATQEQLNRFANLFGKGGSTTVAMRLVQDWERINALAEGAEGADGIGREAFDRVMLNVNNQMKELGATLADLGVDLVETGLVDWIMLLIGATQNLVNIGSDLLNVFNMLPRPLRSVALTLGELYLASRLISGMNVGGQIGAIAAGLQNIFTGRTTVGDAGRGIVGALRFQAPTTAGPLGGQVPVNPAEYTRWQQLQARTGMSGTGLVIGAAAAVAIGAGIADGIGRWAQSREAVQEARSRVAAARTDVELRDAAGFARTQAAEVRDSTLQGLRPGDLTELLPRTIATLTTGQQADALDSIAQAAEDRAKQLESAAEALRANDLTEVFTDFSAEGLQVTMAALEERGFNAAERLNLLNDRLSRFGDLAGDTADAFAALRPEQAAPISQVFGGEFARRMQQEAELRRTQAEALSDPGIMWNPLDARRPGVIADQQRFLSQASDIEGAAPETAARLQAVFEERLAGFLEDSVLSKDELDALLEAVIAEVGPSLDAQGVDDPEARQALETALYALVRGQFDAYRKVFDSMELSAAIRMAPGLAAAEGDETARQTGSRQLGTRAQQEALVRSRATLMQNILNAGSEGQDVSDYLRQLRGVDIAIAETARTMAEDRIAAISAMSQYQQSLLAEDDISGRGAIRLEELRRIQEALRSAPEAGGMDFSRGYNAYQPPTPENAEAQRRNAAQIAEEERRQRQNALAITNAQLMTSVAANDSMGRASMQIQVAQNNFNEATAGEASYYQAQLALMDARRNYVSLQVQAANNAALAATDARDGVARARVAVSNAARIMASSGAGSPEYYAALEQYNGALLELAQARVNVANAERNSRIAGLSSPILQARAALANAQRNLDIQLEGTQGYYDALAGLREAQERLAQAERARADTRRRLRSDLTDPVEQARLDTIRARKELEAARERGEGGDTLEQLEFDLRNAENAEEAAAFRQRIGDLQTAMDLGRISHTMYMQYLKAERDRLSAIKDRTRQQQEQLDEVEKLMKTAAEQLQGQWNIGDIRLPTIYEVRRSMQSNMGSQVADYSHSNNQVYINGADFAAVVGWLQEHLGTSAQMVVGYEDRRV